MPPAQLRNCGRHFFCLSFPSRHPCLPFPRGKKSLFHTLETTVSYVWNNCFTRLKQLFHTFETTVSRAWNNCFIRLKQLEPWTLQREYPDLKRITPYCKHTAFPLLLWSLAKNKIGSINQYQWEVGFLFFSWMDSRLSRHRFCSSFRHAVRYTTEWKTKPAAQRNAYIASWLYKPTWYLNGKRSSCAT